MSGSVGIVAGVSVRQGNLLLSSGFRKNVENQKIMIIKVIIYQRLMNPFNPDNVLPRS
ncbi:hypothetical protein NBRC3280_2715 [Acetobacter pasteurianus NBRC 3280]|uniref:Uncharacterized protein n=2 Tax=Acetobacter TaxID=434 RepID=A0A401X727_ACEPA|nr:hypothetical protein NBRC3277_2713 [Acetobacter pasteurianus NBRC 3277]GCD63644.1 hypothetical protein NBRC3278_2737 [Acetobacter pasteurianus NBRC 3278]GCD70080.1 hypothetical protein NBRC3280_2715 [Acetobacter pasteurianus NBRC 3280]